MGAVSVCERLEKIYFPNSIKRIEDFAFLQDRSLKEVHVPSLSVWCQIDFFNYASNPLNDGNGRLYVNGKKLENDVILPNNITNIPLFAFANCKEIKSVLIFSSVTSIGENIFSSCTGLLQVFYCGSQEEFESKVQIETNNKILLERLHFYSETEPPLSEDGTAYDGQYWRYVDGVPTVWKK